ncbi:hypothetical protein MPSEU_000728600 [Mayamaea pseudoterrestris]|nr:hypothetical protein MPSEU_000728600 [Mayamaea pseudoterrestris]
MATENSTSICLDRQRTEGRRHSGLSALIQAATSQLGHHFEAEKDDEDQIRAATLKSYHGASQDALYDHSHAVEASYGQQHQRFPEQLMTLANDTKNADLITFLPDGKFVAIRAQEFADELMGHWFAVSAFDDFLELAHDWGYSCISDRDCNIQVLRHPLFVQGNWDKCSQIKFGESPTKARLSALPHRIQHDFVIDDSLNSLSIGKRRLSPGFIARQTSESSSTSHRLKIKSSGSELEEVESLDEDDGVAAPTEGSSRPSETLSYTSASRHDELRSIALAITTSELKLSSSCSRSMPSSPSQRYKSPLVDRAVESATHTIVTDAIETLLRDKTHTQKTYLKHESELSRSSLPGVVSLSKQLFSPDQASAAVTPDLAPQTPEPPELLSTKTACGNVVDSHAPKSLL